MTLSVLICTFNRHELLGRALAALIDGSEEPPDEVVVVNGGDERADDVVRDYAARKDVQVKLMRVQNKNLAASRNAGLEHCTGDIIAMTDDDARVFPDWVAEMRRAHAEHPEAGAVGGLVIGSNLDRLVCRVAELVTFPKWCNAQYVRTVPGVNISYKQSVLAKVGRQDETFFRGGEDVDYNWRVKRAGHEVYFDPRIRVFHAHRTSLRGLLNQHYMYGRAYYLVRRKWPEMYCVYPHQIRTTKDLLKLFNAAASLLYQPVLSCSRMPSMLDRIAALPILFCLGLSWKGGMLVEGVRQRTPRIACLAG
jgi:GT2 family glycosyltransferase